MTFGLIIEPLHTIVPGGSYSTNNILFTGLVMNSYSDTVSVNTSREPVFGRTDGITTYSGTERKISMNFYATAPKIGSVERRLRMLQSMLYPTYQKRDGLSPVLVSPPLLRLSYGEITNTKTKPAKDGTVTAPGTATPTTSLVDEIGFLDSFDYALSEAGGSQGGLTVEQSQVTGVGGQGIKTIVTKGSRYYVVNLTFKPIHREIVGFDAANQNGPSAVTGVNPFLQPGNVSPPFNVK